MVPIQSVVLEGKTYFPLVQQSYSADKNVNGSYFRSFCAGDAITLTRLKLTKSKRIWLMSVDTFLMRSEHSPTSFNSPGNFGLTKYVTLFDTSVLQDDVTATVREQVYHMSVSYALQCVFRKQLFFGNVYSSRRLDRRKSQVQKKKNWNALIVRAPFNTFENRK